MGFGLWWLMVIGVEVVGGGGCGGYGCGCGCGDSGCG